MERPAKVETCHDVANVTAKVEPAHPEDAPRMANDAVPASAVTVLPNGQSLPVEDDAEMAEVGPIEDDSSWVPSDRVVTCPQSGPPSARSDIFEGMDFMRCMSESSITRVVSGGSFS